jgi:hypothetical protein
MLMREVHPLFTLRMYGRVLTCGRFDLINYPIFSGRTSDIAADGTARRDAFRPDELRLLVPFPKNGRGQLCCARVVG